MLPLFATLSIVGVAAAQVATTTEPTLPEIEAAASTTLPLSPKSDVRGVAFQRFYQVWLENVDYSSAAGDPNQEWLAQHGIKLTNYFAAGHTSEPNYCAAASGDLYGMDNDDWHQIPKNVSTVVDLLDTKGISWAEYQQHLPYPGFQGFNYSNQETYANDYMRKHNPLILFDSVTDNSTRLRQIKNFTDFHDDMNKRQLPQWAFITPNMTNDAHDTNVTFGSKWLRGFISGLMNNTYVWDETLFLLTFDESEHYAVPNRVFSILIGGAVPKHLIGTEDNTVYTHYSSIATVSANWGLPSLGRWDCGANIFQLVSNKTGYVNYDVDTTNLLINVSLPGPLSHRDYSVYTPNWPIPTTNDSCSAGHGILKTVIEAYKSMDPTFNYTVPFPYDAKLGLDADVAFSKNGTVYVSGVNATSNAKPASSATSSSPSSSSTKNAGAQYTPAAGILAGVALSGLLGLLV